MKRPSNHWRFSLPDTSDLYLRLGIHGLYRLLKHGEGAENFSKVKQSKTLQWEIDEEENTIDLWWESEDDPTQLLRGSWGDFSGGLITNPGYEHDPSKDGAYVTARYHSAVASFFITGPGKKRSKSTGKSSKLEHLLLPYKDKDGKPFPWKMVFTPHTEPPDKVKVVIKAGNQAFSTTLHPAFKTWQGETLKGTAEQAFLLGMSCIAYIFTRSLEGPLGLGIDRPTFREADKVHRRWCFKGSENSGRAVLTIAGNKDTALWVMAVTLGLEGTYCALYQTEGRKTGVKLFSTRLPGNRERKLYNTLPHFFEYADASEKFLRTLGMPLRSYKKGRKNVTMESVLDRVTHNLTHGFRWFRGIYEYHTKNAEPRSTYPRERKLLTNLCQGDSEMNLVEQEVGRKFRNLYVGVALKEAERKRGKKATITQKEWDYADTLVNRTELNRANNTSSLLRAITHIARKSKANPIWTNDEWNYLGDMARKDPVQLKSLLTLATMTRFNTLTDQEVQKRAERLAAGNQDSPESDDDNDNSTLLF